jgi:hypothetical protein
MEKVTDCGRLKNGLTPKHQHGKTQSRHNIIKKNELTED